MSQRTELYCPGPRDVILAFLYPDQLVSYRLAISRYCAPRIQEDGLMLVADTAAHERLAVLTQSQVTSRIDVAPFTRTLQVTASMEFHLRSYLRDPRYGIREVIEVRLIVGGRVSDRRVTMH
jgi:hypothetical protein